MLDAGLLLIHPRWRLFLAVIVLRHTPKQRSLSYANVSRQLGPMTWQRLYRTGRRMTPRVAILARKCQAFSVELRWCVLAMLSCVDSCFVFAILHKNKGPSPNTITTVRSGGSPVENDLNG